MSDAESVSSDDSFLNPRPLTEDEVAVRKLKRVRYIIYFFVIDDRSSDGHVLDVRRCEFITYNYLHDLELHFILWLLQFIENGRGTTQVRIKIGDSSNS